MSEIKLGKYIHKYDKKELEVLFTGKDKVFTRNKMGIESNWNIGTFLEHFTPKPEEHKPIGRLVINGTGALKVRDSNIYPTDTVVTVNKQGILIEVKEC